MKKNKIIRIFKILLEGLFYVFIGLSVFCIFVVIRISLFVCKED